jgi:hypothetical protein
MLGDLMIWQLLLIALDKMRSNIQIVIETTFLIYIDVLLVFATDYLLLDEAISMYQDFNSFLHFVGDL